MRSTILLSFLLIASLRASSQPHRLSREEVMDPRWAFMTVADSMVHVPYQQYAYMHAVRTVADNTIHLAGSIIGAERSRAASVKRELAICGQDKQKIALQLQEREEESAERGAAIGKLEEKVASLKPWANFAKVEVYTTGAALVFLGVNEVTKWVPSIDIIK